MDEIRKRLGDWSEKVEHKYHICSSRKDFEEAPEDLKMLHKEMYSIDTFEES